MTDLFMRFLSISLTGATVALVVFALTRLLARRLSKAWRYYVWLIVLLRLVIPFAPANNLINALHRSITTPAAQVQQQAAPQAQPATAARDADAYPYDPPEPAALLYPTEPLQAEGIAEAAPPREGLTGTLREVWQVAWVLWLGVALMLLVRITTSYRSFARFMRAGWQAVTDAPALDLLDEVCRLHGQKKPLPLYLNPLAASPMLLGVLRPVIVLPALDPDPARMRHILAHEITHHRRRDILLKWFLQAVCCLHWFNPAVYLIRNELHIACELSCDEAVLRRMDAASRLGYGDTLLAVLSGSGRYGDTVASVTMSEEGKMMKKRLESIAAPHARSFSTVALSVMLSLLLMAGAAFAGAYTGESTAPPQADAPAQSDAPTQSLTPGQQLDHFLGDLDTLKDTLKDKAVEVGRQAVEKADEWSQEWRDWAEDFSLDNWGTGDWEDGMDDYEGMFNQQRTDGRTILNRGYFANGLILHLRYDSARALSAEDVTVLENPAVIVPDALDKMLGDQALLDALLAAVEAFVSKESSRWIEYPAAALRAGPLTLVNVHGPYQEDVDTLILAFYDEGDLGRFTAVLNSGEATDDALTALLHRATVDGNVAVFAMMLDALEPNIDADALLQSAYDNENVAIYHIVLPYATQEARQRLQTEALRENKLAFIDDWDLPMPEEALPQKDTDEAFAALSGGIHDTGAYRTALGEELARAATYRYIPAQYDTWTERMRNGEIPDLSSEALLLSVFPPLPNVLNAAQYAPVRERVAWNIVGTALTATLSDAQAGLVGAEDGLQKAAKGLSATIDQVLSADPGTLDSDAAAILGVAGGNAERLLVELMAVRLPGETPQQAAAQAVMTLLNPFAAANIPLDPELLETVTDALTDPVAQPDAPLAMRLLHAVYAMTDYAQMRLTDMLDALPRYASMQEINAVQDAYLDYVFSAVKLHQISYTLGGADASTAVDGWSEEDARLLAVNSAYNDFAQ